MVGKRKSPPVSPKGAAGQKRPPRTRPLGERASAAGARAPRERCDYRLLALDLDGTLLNNDGVANDVDVAAIRKLRARGVKVTIITGRLYSGTRESAELLGIDGPVGCADGSHIVNAKNDRTLLHRGIRGRAADRLRTSLERNDLVAFLFAEDAIVHDERGAEYLPYVRTWSTDLRYAHRITEHALWDSDGGMTAVVALGKESSIGRTVADIQRDETEAMQVAMFPFRRDSEQWGMVARASGGTKGTALQWVSDHYGIPIAETVCVGDWLNDLPMMSRAGRSFAMGQAPSEVKAAATEVLDRTIDAGGAIAEAIARAFGPKV
jgi:hypothetical protein